ncbi:MAG TPA: winged helix-turn-helix domain-containing protein [Nocardioidaceae bacterium]|nr:winged helix-turn-helix domain-containing protein [Nocardioidaceae bacterium]
MGLPEERPARRPATDAEARALASGLRLQILRLTLDEALTNKEIAERLDKNPATVLHHVRTLVDTGFLHAEPVRRGTRGSREVPYRATGKSWTLEAAGAGRAVLDAFLGEAGQVPLDDIETTRLGLRLTAEEVEELRRRLQQLFDEFASRPHASGAEPWSLFLAMHPDAGRR